jgi:hypothetical protein
MKGLDTGLELHDKVQWKWNLNRLSFSYGKEEKWINSINYRSNGKQHSSWASHLVVCHCIIHHRSLCLKAVKLNCVMQTVVFTVNIIHTQSQAVSRTFDWPWSGT